MGNGFSVDVNEVRAHAATVANVAGQVQTQGSNAQDSVTGGAYGQLGEFFAAGITEACGQLRDTIGTASQTVRQMHNGLNAAADAYQNQDDTHAQLLR